ncbi:HD domain-containing protein [Oceanobacillus damuensis]|uniref:HD domain-containing protein n=1 Tax=Oceanobacillus damuensis TaxID=937928 RepID=UPI0009FEC0C6|nr:HD domain-containing protein [Oceanobacillus damuensis]
MKAKAKAFAIRAHEGQKRKNSNAPYISHPIRVAERLENEGFSDELVSAGYLHDVAEDTDVEIDDIKREFGHDVAHIVAAHTEDKSKSWQERKQHTIDTLKNVEKEIKYLIIADKLDNLIGLEQDMKQQGEAIWKNFNAGYDQQLWYNQSIVKNMYAGLKEKDIPDYFREYEEVVQRVFG